MSAELALNLALAFVALEFCLLLAWRGRRGQALSILAALAPGLCLMLAVRAAVLGETLAMLAWITASLPLHLLDLARRRFFA